tara:strand:+ start:75 stop:548 length:474 start_codon:yes stop_codon:yes gene_type:complete
MLFDKLNHMVCGKEFSWYFNDHTLDKKDSGIESRNHFMFTHYLFGNGEQLSDHFPFFEPILYTINETHKVSELLRMKLNLYTQQHKNYHHAAHTDWSPEDNIKVGILNFVTCNGGTKIDGKIYKSRKNEMLICNNKRHNGITQTDTPIRVVLNICWK